MARDINQVTIEGNITRDPELRFTPSGTAVMQLGIAVNHSRKGADGEWTDEANFIDVTLFSSLAEQASETFEKGNRVVVNGRLSQRSWEDKDSGDKRSKVEIVADVVAPSLRFATATLHRVERTNG